MSAVAILFSPIEDFTGAVSTDLCKTCGVLATHVGTGVDVPLALPYCRTCALAVARAHVEEVEHALLNAQHSLVIVEESLWPTERS